MVTHKEPSPQPDPFTNPALTTIQHNAALTFHLEAIYKAICEKCEHIAQDVSQIKTDVSQIKMDVEQLKPHLRALDANNIARVQNRTCNREVPLLPLYNIKTNEPIEGFPAMSDDMYHLTEPEIDSILRALGIRVEDITPAEFQDWIGNEEEEDEDMEDEEDMGYVEDEEDDEDQEDKIDDNPKGIRGAKIRVLRVQTGLVPVR